MGQKCNYIKANGEQCGRWARVGEDRCAWHDGTDHRQRVQAKGNAANKAKHAEALEAYADVAARTIGPDLISTLNYFASRMDAEQGAVATGWGNLVMKCRALLGEMAERKIEVALVPAEPRDDRPKVE